MLTHIKAILKKYPKTKKFLRWVRKIIVPTVIFVPIIHFWRRLGLQNRDFSIISCNCSGGYIYQYFGLPYRTPTVGLFFSYQDYLNLIQNPRYYFSQELQFIDPTELNESLTFPVGKLGDIRIYFMHYKTEEEAREKWTRRVQRINYDRLVFLLAEFKHMSTEHVEAFNQIDCPNKIFLAIHDYPDCLSAVKVIDTFSQDDLIPWLYEPVVSALPWKRVLNKMQKTSKIRNG